MKKSTGFMFFIVAFLLFLISYQVDYQVDLLFKSIRFSLLDSIFGIITNFGIVAIVVLIIPSIILYRKNIKSAYLLWTIMVCAVISSLIIKLIVLRQRPEGALVYPLIKIINYSFPSTHAMVVFALLPALARFLPKQKFFWIIFAFLVALTRVYFSLHFLSDVVFGSYLGYFIGTFLLKMHEKGKLWI